ncbi:hypothetical protein [Nocardia miyunensis]|uniref:hypothetical protein n=1 Tax=Nocardia miyunensis TaxID=282684 RepID=UPI0008330911|nr:hypothetical protein [Nocardia miyunensis]
MAEAATEPTQVAEAGDLRKQPIEQILTELQARLGTRFAESTMVRKRRSVGVQSDRDTWIRIEARPIGKAAAQAQINNGIEASTLLDGIAKPRWHQTVSWLDEPTQVLWRADECELITGPAAQPIGYPLTEPDLSPAWWRTLNESLDNLARQHTSRIATPDTQSITQALVTDTIEQVFPGRVDTTITDHPWVPAHADLVWSNLTAPVCWILDWEDLGLAPRGLDAATLWMNSIMVPALADRVYAERRADLTTRSGRIMALFYAAKELSDPSFASTPAYEPTMKQAAELLENLRP